MPYGTEAAVYKGDLAVVIFGPGDITLAQLYRAVDVYTRLIERLCG